MYLLQTKKSSLATIYISGSADTCRYFIVCQLKSFETYAATSYYVHNILIKYYIVEVNHAE